MSKKDQPALAVSSYEDFTNKLKKIPKQQLNQFFADELLRLRNSCKSGIDLPFSVLLKVLYFHTNGFDVTFAHVEFIKFAASNKNLNKRLGYITLGVIMNRESETLLLLTQSILYDLQKKHSNITRSIALTALLLIGDEDMYRAVLPEFPNLIRSKSVPVQNKTLLAMDKLIKYSPDFAVEFKSNLSKLSDKVITPTFNHGSLISLLQLYTSIIKTSYSDYIRGICKKVSPLMKIFLSLHLTEVTSPEFGVIDSEDPFLQIILLRFFDTLYTQLKKNNDIELLEGIEFIFNTSLGKILAFHIQEEYKEKKPRNKKIDINIDNDFNSNRSSTGISKSTSPSIAVLLEIVKLVLSYSLDSDMQELAFKVTYSLFLLPNTNLRFMCIQFLSKFIHNSQKIHSETLENILLKSIEDRDPSVRRQGLGLIYHLTTEANAMSIATDLVEHMKGSGAHKHIRKTLYDTLFNLITRFENLPIDWKIKTLIDIISLNNNDIDHPNVTNELLLLINKSSHNFSLLQEIVQLLRGKLNSQTINDTSDDLIYVSLWTVGEFCDNNILTDADSLLTDIRFVIDKYKNNNNILKCALNSLMKLRGRLYIGNDVKKREVEEIFSLFIYSFDEEIQKRSSEYITMSQLIPDNNLYNFFLQDNKPIPDNNNSINQFPMTENIQNSQNDNNVNFINLFSGFLSVTNPTPNNSNNNNNNNNQTSTMQSTFDLFNMPALSPSNNNSNSNNNNNHSNNGLHQNFVFNNFNNNNNNNVLLNTFPSIQSDPSLFNINVANNNNLSNNLFSMQPNLLPQHLQNQSMPPNSFQLPLDPNVLFPMQHATQLQPTLTSTQPTTTNNSQLNFF